MPKTLTVGGVPEHFNWPWRLAEADGAFTDAGAPVHWVDFPGGTGAMLQAMETGDIDVALLLTEGALADAINANDNVLVKVWVRTPVIWGIHVAADSRLRRPSHLKGARIAISRYRSGSHLMAYVDALNRGWPIDALEFVVVGNLDGARRALAADEADFFMWERFTTSPLVRSGEWRRLDDCVGPWPALTLAVPKKRLARVRERLKKALVVADRYAYNLVRRRHAVAEISTAYGLNPAETAAWFKHVRWSQGTRRPTSALRDCADVLLSAGIVEALPTDLDTVWARL
ncbi:MAG: PhnD/SsuA/transferrin family substrate-binding protein [Pseudomonadota bacterium]